MMRQYRFPEPERSSRKWRSANGHDTCLYDIDTETAMLLLESCGVAFAWQPVPQRQQTFRDSAACFRVDPNHPRWSQTASDMLRDAMPRINHYLRQRIWAEYGEQGLTRSFQLDGVSLVAIDQPNCDRVIASTPSPPRSTTRRPLAT